MSKKKSKGKQRHLSASVNVNEKIRVALRSIIRDWKSLSAPLPVDVISEPVPLGAQKYRIRGAECYEELQERLLKFAGRVWQLKDGLIHWLMRQSDLQLVIENPVLGAVIVGTSGPSARPTIEEAAKLCQPLLLCADLYNTYKHYDDCNRSGYQPYLNGVELDSSNSGLMEIYYDGARKVGDFTVTNPHPVPYRIEIFSRNHAASFGNAVTVIGRGFAYWIPFIQKLDILDPSNVVDKAILHDLFEVERSINSSTPFKLGQKVTTIENLPVDEQRLAMNDPAAFVANIMKT